jgi:preprotein translocase subunit SecA
LKKNNFDFFILNDIQKESEDYILNNMGHVGNILIATNAAGRGTDIIIDDNSKKNGGLYFIIGFFLKNYRIEFQDIGRAGR